MNQDMLHLDGPFSGMEKGQVDSFVTSYIYHGTIDLPTDGRHMKFHLEQLASRPCQLYRVHTASSYGWRRTQADIRKDGADFCAVRLLISGQARIIQNGRTVDMMPGDMLINRSILPVRVEIAPDPHTPELEMLIVLIPSATLQQGLDVDQVINCLLPRENSHYRMITDLLALLQARADDIDEETGQWLSRALSGEILKLGAAILAPEQDSSTISGIRLADIRAQIRTHFANPNLSLEMIARKCGISPRYVTHIMKKYETSFYDEVRLERLNAARRILQGKNGHVPIKQVAFYTGFKSASHFSTAYKRAFGLTPNEERDDMRLAAKEESPAHHLN